MGWEAFHPVAAGSPAEESPGSAGQGAGEIPVGANPRKVPQKIYRPLTRAGKGEKAR